MRERVYILIDVSGSMNAPFSTPPPPTVDPDFQTHAVKLDAARQEVLKALSKLDDHDVCLIAFSDEAKILREARGGDISLFASVIERLQASGGTNVAAALRLAMNNAENRRASILLVSDGLSTVGDPLAAAQDCRNRSAGTIPIRIALIDPAREALPLITALTSLDNVSVNVARSPLGLAHSITEAVQAFTGAATRTGHVFLSYASEDRPYAERIRSELLDAGAPVWIDRYELGAGDSLRERIEGAISASAYVVVLLSRHSVHSKWIQHEIAGSFSREISARAVTLVPVLIEDCEIPALLSHLKYVDLRAHKERGIHDLVAILGRAPRIDFARLDAHQFEQLVADLFAELGFKLQTVGHGRDTGVDIVATRPASDPFGPEKPQRWLVQAKHYAHSRANLRSIQQLAAQLDPRSGVTEGVIATTAQFTSAVHEWAALQEERGVRLHLLDGTAIKRLLLQNPQIVSKYFEEAP